MFGRREKTWASLEGAYLNKKWIKLNLPVVRMRIIYDQNIEKAIEDRDIKENNSTKIKFRKVPYGAWIMGLMFWGAAVFIVYTIFEELLTFKHHS